MDRLHQNHPGRFPEGRLRTLQRRIREWRNVMAKSLVQGCQGTKDTEVNGIVVGSEITKNTDGSL
jgi:hypothetical protein